jgi:hypothetical protein
MDARKKGKQSRITVGVIVIAVAFVDIKGEP